MSGIATILLDCGVCISGSDEVNSPGTDRLLARGAAIGRGHAAANLPTAADVVVYSSAVSPANPELAAAQQRQLPCIRRGEFLARLATFFECVIAVGGSHGKTTTTAMIAHILKECGLRPGFLIGGEVNGWELPATAGSGRILVTEVDESDGTQAFMHSTCAVVTNIEDDHCWSLGGIEPLEACFQTFAALAQRVICWSTPATQRLFADLRQVTYLEPTAIPANLALPVPGQHNRTNATLAVEAAVAAGAEREEAIQALSSFPGVGRRMTERFVSPDRQVRIVEDYAHHPTELQAALQTLREAYPESRLVAVFQPHRFERVKRYAQDFSRILATADRVVVVRPFAAWVGDGDIADPSSIARDITDVPCRYWDGEFDALAADLLQDLRTRPGEAVVAVIGAGDVNRVITLLRQLLVRDCLEACADQLRAECPHLPLSLDTPWAELTSLGVGGGIPLLAEPGELSELTAILRCSTQRNLNIFPLGHGTNIVGSDMSLPTIALRLARGRFTEVAVNAAAESVSAGAGTGLPELLRMMMREQLLPAKAAPLAWIPGSVGGAVRMNAGADGSVISDFVNRVEGIRHDGRSWAADHADINWQYRATDIPEDIIITRVHFRFPPADNGLAKSEYKRTGNLRQDRQPAGHSAGCVFRNAGTESAGRLLDKAGCKGMSFKACHVSNTHANFILTEPSACEEDLMRLILRAQRQTFEHSGVRLVPEVVFTNPATAQRVAHALPPARITVLKGGPSAERDISLRSGAAVATALRAAGHTVAEVDIRAADLPDLPANTDIVFPALHGAFGEDGGVQTLLEQRRIPYVGSGPQASALIMSKLATKKRLSEHGIPTPHYACLESAAAPIPDHLTFPVVIKPDCQGSTVGMSRLNKPSGWWRRALRQAFAVDSAVFAEEFITGIEITVGVLQGRSLPVIEIVPPAGRMFDFDAKYNHIHGHTQYLCPPLHVSETLQREARQMAEQVFSVLGAKDMLRVDFMIDNAGQPWVLEANSIPGFTATSLLPKAAQAAGISFVELCASLALGKTIPLPDLG
jgi:UDP-N-acetylmuramate--alanine ligase